MANIIKVAEIVFKKLQATGAPLVGPTADDVLVVNYGQDISIEDQITEGERLETKGPAGVVCALEDSDEFTGVTATGNLAKWPKKLKWFSMGGTYDAATDKWTPPMQGKLNVNPVTMELYAEKYADGENTSSDLLGYEKIVFPKAKIKLGALEISNTAFTAAPLTVEGKDYVDNTVPANSKPSYYFDTMAASLPSEGSYAQPFHIADSVGDVDGAVVSVTVNGSPVTDTSDVDGLAELTLPYGVHGYTVTKTGYATKTGTVAVGIVNDTEEVLVVTG